MPGRLERRKPDTVSPSRTGSMNVGRGDAVQILEKKIVVMFDLAGVHRKTGLAMFARQDGLRVRYEIRGRTLRNLVLLRSVVVRDARNARAPGRI